jgi:hypothetical protein
MPGLTAAALATAMLGQGWKLAAAAADGEIACNLQKLFWCCFLAQLTESACAAAAGNTVCQVCCFKGVTGSTTITMRLKTQDLGFLNP